MCHDFVRPRGSAKNDAATKVVERNIGELAAPNSTVHQGDSDGDLVADNVRGLLIRVSDTSTREIDNLIADLRMLREKMQTDGGRVESDVEQFMALNQSVMQLAKIISDGMTLVKKKPEASTTGGATRNY